ncbi:hypothetical protein DL768_011182 [Monosporascus sp. mg162]|nr:hypothetical protein DL768_011182 [Monosporascus sp. mg162]
MLFLLRQSQVIAYAFLLQLLLPIAGITTKAQPHPKESFPNPALEAIREKHHLPGLAAAHIRVQRHGNIIARAVGVRRFGNDSRLTTKDQFHLGSLTKAMTSTLIAMLIEEPGNSLTWNSTVPEALPHLESIVPAHRNTTLAMLGAHVAGFNDTLFMEEELPLWLDILNGTYTPTDGRRLLAERAFSYEPATLPGQNYSYSNLGYMILGHLIDTYAPKECGSWEQFIHGRLFKPLRMNGCGLGPVPQKTPASITNPWPHAPGNPDPIPVPWDTDNPPTVGPAGTVHCTIDSYAKFLSLHVNGFVGKTTPLLPADAFRILHTPYRVLSGLPARGDAADSYSPGGWISMESPDVGGRYLFHDGSNSVNFAWAIVAPGVREAFFIGTNVGEASEAMNEVAIGLFTDSLGF